MSPSELVGSALWRYCPPWLGLAVTRVEEELVMPEECMKEMKVSAEHVLVTSSNSHGVGKIMNATNFSALGKLLRITAYVVRFCKILRAKIQQQELKIQQQELKMPAALEALEVQAVETLWIKEAQSCFRTDDTFKMWEHQFVLFLDEGVWRCKGRLGNADVSYASRYPALLTKEHPLAILIVKDAHSRVMHNAVKETLTEIRSKYWIIKGRQFVRKIIH